MGNGAEEVEPLKSLIKYRNRVSDIEMRFRLLSAERTNCFIHNHVNRDKWWLAVWSNVDSWRVESCIELITRFDRLVHGKTTVFKKV